MSVKRVLGRCAATAVLLGFLANVEAATFAEVKAAQESSLKQIRESCRTDVGKLSDLLLSALERGREAAKKTGDLELVKAYDTEVELIKLVGEPPALESSIPAITKLQTIYKTSREERYGRMYRAIVAWQKTSDAELAALEKKLVIENQVPAAEEVRAEREKAAEDPAVVEAIAAMEKLDAAKPTTPVTPPQKASASDKPWQFLTRLKWKEIDGSKYFLSMIAENEGIEFEGKNYKKRDVIYCHAPGKVVYEFKDPITSFKAKGCIEERSGNGNVIFIVETADGEVYRSPEVKKDHNHENITVEFKPTKKLVIRVDDNGGAQEDWAFWLQPQYR